MFVTLQDGRVINTAHVTTARVDRTADRDWYVTFELTTGDQLRSRVWSPDVLDHLATTVIPAGPGYETLQLSVYDDGEHLDRCPVVGWRIGEHGEVIGAVALDECEPGGHPLLYPDGRVVQLDIQTWPNLDRWMADERERQSKGVEP